MKLKGKVALITGAGQGIGEAYAKRFAAEGATVVVADINAEKGQAVAQALGTPHRFEKLDVSNEDDTKRITQAVFDTFGKIDVLLNNAAIFYGIDNFDTSFAYLKKIFDVNYFGTWLMCKAAFPHIAKGGGGSVINQSSSAAWLHPEYPILDDNLPSFHYSVTKAAINAMTHFMAGSVGKYNIRVNAIAPGPTMTEATLVSRTDLRAEVRMSTNGEPTRSSKGTQITSAAKIALIGRVKNGRMSPSLSTRPRRRFLSRISPSTRPSTNGAAG